MKVLGKALGVLVLMLGAASSVASQEVPAGEVSFGYSYVHSNIVASSHGVNMQGGSGAFSYNVNKWFGVVGDFGGYHQSNVRGAGFDVTVVTYLFGPRFSWRTDRRLTPFAQVLLGGGHAGGSLYTSSLAAGLAPLGANNGFVMTAGGGLDWVVRPHIAIRILQAEYLRTQFSNGTNGQQNNFRLTAGIVFRLGQR